MITCYECNQKIRREHVKPDRGFRNDMQTLSITCNFCKWTGVLKNYQVILFLNSLDIITCLSVIESS